MSPERKDSTGISLEMALLVLILVCIVIALSHWLFRIP